MVHIECFKDSVLSRVCRSIDYSCGAHLSLRNPPVITAGMTYIHRAPIINPALQWAAVAAISLAVAGCGLFASDDDGIVWHDEDLGELVVFAFAPMADTLDMIDPATGEVLARYGDFGHIVSLAATDDGTRLYVSTGSIHGGRSPGAIHELHIPSGARRIIHHTAGHLLPDSRGSIFFISAEATGTRRGFGFVDTQSGIVTVLDTVDTFWRGADGDLVVQVDADRQRMVMMTADRDLVIYDLVSREATPAAPELPAVAWYRLTLSHGGDTLYIPGGVVVDLAGREVVGKIPSPQRGNVVARRDNRRVYLTDPGKGYMWGDPSARLIVYAPDRDRSIAEIDLRPTGVWNTDWISLTPKERYAVVGNSSSALMIFDLKTHRMVARYDLASPDRWTRVGRFIVARRAVQ
jgi:hypothetical protein